LRRRVVGSVHLGGRWCHGLRVGLTPPRPQRMFQCSRPQPGCEEAETTGGMREERKLGVGFWRLAVAAWQPGWPSRDLQGVCGDGFHAKKTGYRVSKRVSTSNFNSHSNVVIHCHRTTCTRRSVRASGFIGGCRQRDSC
jgi:hypothetical protein